MKVNQLLKSILGLVVLINLISCSQDVKTTIMDSFMNAPKKEMFKVFHFLFEKTYELNSEEALRKYKVFKSNLKFIEETNSQDLTYKLGVNQFTDLTHEEFKSMYLMDPNQKKTMLTDTIENLRSEEGSADYFDLNADRDDEIIKQGAYTPINWITLFGNIRNQGNCGSCWAFASLGVVEAMHAKKSGVRKSLSVQQLVDCDKSNQGCKGGWFTTALEYIRKNGVMDEVDYPYTAVQGTCKFTTTKPLTKILSYQGCQKCSTDKVYNLLKTGPLMVGIDSGSRDFQLYKSGIFSGPCYVMNKAVILVGYGIENGKEFWLVRNSWGSGWGDRGYIKVARNESNNNSCFVTSYAFGVDV